MPDLRDIMAATMSLVSFSEKVISGAAAAADLVGEADIVMVRKVLVGWWLSLL